MRALALVVLVAGCGDPLPGPLPEPSPAAPCRTTCNGCCVGETCLSGMDVGACGYYGNACAACAASEDCGASKSCHAKPPRYVTVGLKWNYVELQRCGNDDVRTCIASREVSEDYLRTVLAPRFANCQFDATLLLFDCSGLPCSYVVNQDCLSNPSAVKAYCPQWQGVSRSTCDWFSF